MKTVGRFEVREGEEVGFVLSWTPSFQPDPPKLPAAEAIAAVEAFWTDWAAAFTPGADWSGAILRSLLTLKALPHRQPGRIPAAAPPPPPHPHRTHPCRE